MTQQAFTRMAGVLFMGIALLHLLRVIFGWEAVINGWSVPHGVSWIAVLVFGGLASAAFKLKR